MQLRHDKWPMILAAAFSASILCAGVIEQTDVTTGCAKDPFSVTLLAVHIRSGKPLRELAKIGLENRVCIGFEGPQDEKPISFDSDRISLPELLSNLFPGFSLEVTNSVLNLRQPDRQKASWLDYKIRSFRTMRTSLEFNGLHQLFFFLRDQVYKPSGGYIASIPIGVPSNQVGPMDEQNRTVRALLNLLVSESTQGGIWVVRGSYPQSRPLPDDEAFWKLAPYGGSFDLVLTQLGL